MMIYGKEILKEFLVPVDRLNAKELLMFAERISKDIGIFSVVERLLLKLLMRFAKEQTAVSLERAYLLSEMYEKTKLSFLQLESMNLDKKQAFISIIYQIAEVI